MNAYCVDVVKLFYVGISYCYLSFRKRGGGGFCGVPGLDDRQQCVSPLWAGLADVSNEDTCYLCRL